MTPEHRGLIERIRSSAVVVRRAVEAAPPARFGVAPRAGEWSALETLTHLRDVVVHVYGLRIRRLLYEDTPVFMSIEFLARRVGEHAEEHAAQISEATRGA
jgi:hypothetical protein